MLLLAADGQGVVPQGFGHGHLNGTPARHHLAPHQAPLHDAQGVVDAPVGLFDELLGAAPQDDGGGLGVGAAREHVEALFAHLQSPQKKKAKEAKTSRKEKGMKYRREQKRTRIIQSTSSCQKNTLLIFLQSQTKLMHQHSANPIYKYAI